MKIKNTYFFWGVQRCKTAIYYKNFILPYKQNIFSFLKPFLLLLFLAISGCKSNSKVTLQEGTNTDSATEILTGANQMALYIPLLKNKKVAVVSNQSSLIKNGQTYTHLIDSLLSLGISVKKVLSPEHGFRGKADAGEKVLNGIDTKTGLPILSLYGAHKKPTKSDLKNIQILLFDLQDVGVRFYTYLSTLHYVMEAAAENHIPLIVLDRPNPNAHYIDGPVLEDQFHSFVGLHPVPIVYGMTIGEYAQMINGEMWLHNGLQCELQVIPLKNYTHTTAYDLPVKPSPNLPNARAINLYPSLCFFEGTTISCGRGTNRQFQIFGNPFLPKSKYPYSFTPTPNTGAKHPKYDGESCNGINLEKGAPLGKIRLEWLLNTYKDSPDKKNFFLPFSTKLAGTNQLQNQIELGYSAKDIKKTWQPGLEKFKKIRAKYLLYH